MIRLTPRKQSQSNYLTAKEPEQRVAHIPPMVAPGPETMTCSHFSEYQYTNDISPEMSRDFVHKSEQNFKLTMSEDKKKRKQI